jgi:hypothetical protein
MLAVPVVTVSLQKEFESIQHWQEQTEPLAAQKQGRDVWYE